MCVHVPRALLSGEGTEARPIRTESECHVATQAKGVVEPITARHLLSHTSGIREFRHTQDLVDVVRHRMPGMLGGKVRLLARSEW